jgi:lysozyme
MIIDVSSNNGHIDFSQVAPQVEKVVIRVSLGYGTEDQNAQYYAPHAATAGIPVLYYHFAYEHDGVDPVADATKQANYFLQCIANFPAYEDLVIDLEPKDAQGDDTNLTQDQFATWLQTFLDVAEAATGKQLIIYTYADYLNRHLPAGHTFGKYRLWIANYGNVTNPPLPNGWTSYYMWQYSESGQVNGIATKVDCSRLNPGQ